MKNRYCGLKGIWVARHLSRKDLNMRYLWNRFPVLNSEIGLSIQMGKIEFIGKISDVDVNIADVVNTMTLST